MHHFLVKYISLLPEYLIAPRAELYWIRTRVPSSAVGSTDSRALTCSTEPRASSD